MLRDFELTAGWSEQQLREVAAVLTLHKLPADKVVVHQARGWVPGAHRLALICSLA